MHRLRQYQSEKLVGCPVPVSRLNSGISVVNSALVVPGTAPRINANRWITAPSTSAVACAATGAALPSQPLVQIPVRLRRTCATFLASSFWIRIMLVLPSRTKNSEAASCLA